MHNNELIGYAHNYAMLTYLKVYKTCMYKYVNYSCVNDSVWTELWFVLCNHLFYKLCLVNDKQIEETICGGE